MNMIKTIAISTIISAVTLVSSAAISGDTKSTTADTQRMMYGKPCHMPMMDGKEGQMPYMQMMQQRHAAADEHMKRMEAHMERVEALLKQLVELQKK